MMDPPGHQKDKTCGDQRTDKSCYDQRIRRYHLKPSQKINHRQSYHHFGSGRNTEYKGPCNRIFKEGL